VLVEDWRQVLRLNRILERWITSWPKNWEIPSANSKADSIPAVKRTFDWDD